MKTNLDASSSITRISELSKALSEELRLRILMCLKGGPLGLQHFIEIFHMAPSTLSKHLHILEKAGLVVSIRHGRWRLYKWPKEHADGMVSGLLNWLEESACSDASLETDAARRAVAIQTNPFALPPSDVIRVLFLCTGNSSRSQMAEALLRARGSGRCDVASAGVSPRAIPSLTREVMHEAGIDISDQRPKSIMKFIGKAHFDYLITVCALAEEHVPVFPGVTHRLHWPVDDPAKAKGTKDQKKKVFRRVRDLLDAKIGAWLEELA